MRWIQNKERVEGAPFLLKKSGRNKPPYLIENNRHGQRKTGIQRYFDIGQEDLGWGEKNKRGIGIWGRFRKKTDEPKKKIFREKERGASHDKQG
jgi:hypothetical protein